jgi:predicted nucleotidyltransferase
MKFHDYLEQLFSTPTSISLVRSLISYRGKIFTIRGLAKVAHVSSSQSAVVIGQLEKMGIVVVQPVGRSSLVSLNEKSYILNRIMKPMIRAEKETLEELLYVLRKWFHRDKKISAVILFGSISRREEREESDIDLLVISNDFDYASGLLSKVGEQVSSIFGNRLSPMIMSEKELILKRKEALVRDIETSHIDVAGRKLGEILKQQHD